MAEVLYDDQTFKVVLHEHPGAQTVVVGFQYRLRPGTEPPPGEFPPPFIPASVAESDIPAHVVSFLVNRNNWYLGPQAEAAAQTIRARFPTERLVTYGSSMGGYAAINLAPLLRADYVLAISAQSTPFPPFADMIGDRRYVIDRPGLSQDHDRIASGISQNLRGLLFFDPSDRLDSPHAARIATLTSLTLIGVPGSGHPSGPLLNKVYPLKTILREVITGEPDLAAIRKVMHALDLAATPTEGDWFRPMLDKVTAPSFDLATVAPGLLSRLARACLEEPEVLGEGTERLERFIGVVLDPRMDWGDEVLRRSATLRMCCTMLMRRGQRARARALAEEHLPPDMAAPFLRKP
ncbi:hypothetical protein [Stagnihabitans tardus]|uniref:Alpha/beta hydrolase n=1 Tax=Stagnihabitans tardus TaxID=2699202 RepID=A0AAE4YA64_9RHOB|nr:hypothetical protein [Stagnihabitans tardus]NBZ86549.1 hypothetical protein [Stagnihabitans tardus]